MFLGKKKRGEEERLKAEKLQKGPKLAALEKTDKTILGQCSQPSDKLLVLEGTEPFRPDSNILVVGAESTGKTHIFGKSYCLQALKRGESVVVYDQDSSLYRKLAPLFKEKGYVVKHLDLAHPETSDAWNCLSAIRPAQIEKDIRGIVATIVDGIEGISNSDQSGIYCLLKALIMRVISGDDFRPEDKHLGTVITLIGPSFTPKTLDGLFGSSEDKKAGYAEYQCFKQASDRYQVYLANTLRLTIQNMLQKKETKDVLTKSDIDLSLPARTACAYFIGYPDCHNLYQSAITLFFSSMHFFLGESVAKQPLTFLPTPVNVFADQITDLCPRWTLFSSICRHSAKSPNYVFTAQSFLQLESVFPDINLSTDFGVVVLYPMDYAAPYNEHGLLQLTGLPAGQFDLGFGYCYIKAKGHQGFLARQYEAEMPQPLDLTDTQKKGRHRQSHCLYARADLKPGELDPLHIGHFCFKRSAPYIVSEEECAVCQEYRSKYIEFPITVSKIEHGDLSAGTRLNFLPGQIVQVEVCDPEEEGKQYAGILLGALPIDISTNYNPKTQVLTNNMVPNPAIWVPALHRVVYGMECWWAPIESFRFIDTLSSTDDFAWLTSYVKQYGFGPSASNPGSEPKGGADI